MYRYLLSSTLLFAAVLMVGCGQKSYEPKAEDIPDIPPSTRAVKGGGVQPGK